MSKRSYKNGFTRYENFRWLRQFVDAMSLRCQNKFCLPGRHDTRGVGNFSTGFTLIELLVVIAIIVILAGIILANLGNPRASGRDARRISEIQQVRTSLEEYYNSTVGNNNYPASPGGTGTARWCALQSTLRSVNPSLTLPVDPTNTGSCDTTLTASGSLYYDYSSSGGQSYNLRARLETKNVELNRSYHGAVLDCSDSQVYCISQP